jgi:hypothetical protein
VLHSPFATIQFILYGAYVYRKLYL